MMFCPKCGSLLKSKIEKDKSTMFCSCGFSSNDLDNAEIKEKVVSKENNIEIVENNVEAYPIVDAKCEKCGNDKAYYWLVQTRSSDEAETKFMKCTKCQHVWRDYS